MTRIVSLFFGLLCLSSMAFAGVDHVIVVSIDGGKPASIKKSKMPVLESIIREGASTFEAKTIYPSKTLPSHVSMLTGVDPSVHKIKWNYWNIFRGAVKVPTIFSLAKARGLSTALFATKAKFRHLKAKGSLDKFSLDAGNAIESATLASKYLAARKPNLLFVHMPDADKAGHSKGWESREQLAALEKVDQAIGILKSEIERSLQGKTYALIITADHGGTGKDHGMDSYDDRTIPWVVWGTSVRPAYDIAGRVETIDTAATALWLLDIPTPPTWNAEAVVEAFEQ